jgi:hypothetical protein
MKQPIAVVEYEGDYFRPWVTVAEREASRNGDGRPSLRNPDRAHAIIFDDGSAFDMFNGWRNNGEPDAEIAANVKRLIGEYRSPDPLTTEIEFQVRDIIRRVRAV